MDRAFVIAEKIQMRLGMPGPVNTILICASGAVFPFRTSTAAPAFHNIFGRPNPTRPSPSELAGMQSACDLMSSFRARGGLAGSGGGLGGTDGNWVDNTIAQIDQAVSAAGCGKGSPVASGGGFGPVGEGVGAIMDLFPDFAKYIKFNLISLLIEVGKMPNDQSEEEKQSSKEYKAATAEYLAIDAYWEAQESEAYAQAAEKAATNAEATASQLEAEAAAHPDDADAQKEAAAARSDADAARQEADRARTEADQKKQDADKRAKDADEKAKEAGTSSPPTSNPQSGTQNPGPDDVTSTCHQAQWEFLKWYCTESGGWDRPGSGCNELLRRANGCVDSNPGATDPTPDGGQPSCFGLQPDEQELLRIACQAYMKVASPVSDEASNVCSGQPPPNSQGMWPNICNDPRAMPSEDQCGGRTTIPIDYGSMHIAPIGVPPGANPVSNLGVFGGVLVYDGLRLNGFGLGGLPGLSSKGGPR